MSVDVENEPGYVGYTDTSPSSAKVSCAVSFADVLQVTLAFYERGLFIYTDSVCFSVRRRILG